MNTSPTGIAVMNEQEIMEAAEIGFDLPYGRMAEAFSEATKLLTTKGAELEQLRADNERLREDKQRLDWLQKQREDIAQPTMPYGEPELIGSGWGVQAQTMCVRDAIDQIIELENTNAN